MNTLPIDGIKKELKSMYPGYRYDMRAISSIYSYSITAYKGQNNLSTITISAETPLTTFWEQIKDWMRRIIIVNGA